MSLVIEGSTIIDGVAEQPLAGQTILIDSGRIKAIGRRDEIDIPAVAEVIDARGKYVIPGLMDANVHLLIDVRMEILVRYEGRYEELIAEAAQLTLKTGVTTVFDSWGPRQALMNVRDQIAAGEVAGSRIFCAGNIIGLDGPLSHDFFPKTLEVASGALVDSINSLWAENSGSELMWMTPHQVAHEVRTYIERGVDFIKYASSDHRGWGPAFLAFSPRVQAGMVEEAHRVGITAQAHTTSVESLWAAIEAGVDIIQHCDITGPVPIPAETLQRLLERQVASTVFPMTERRYRLALEKCGVSSQLGKNLAAWDLNDRNLIKSGATLLLATDAGITAADALTDPYMRNFEWWVAGDDRLTKLGEGHFHWLQAMEEKGLAPMDILRAATRNIAVAYRKDQDLGTLEPGKIADMVILDRNPLQSAENYRSIQAVIKDGVVVNTAALPAKQILTRPAAEPIAGQAPRSGAGRFPFCC
jgi:imidazolonepropionase-like amidohydrolase